MDKGKIAEKESVEWYEVGTRDWALGNSNYYINGGRETQRREWEKMLRTHVDRKMWNIQDKKMRNTIKDTDKVLWKCRGERLCPSIWFLSLKGWKELRFKTITVSVSSISRTGISSTEIYTCNNLLFQSTLLAL